MLREALADVGEVETCVASVIFHLAVPLVGRELRNRASGSYWSFRNPPIYSSGSAPQVDSARLLAWNPNLE